MSEIWILFHKSVQLTNGAVHVNLGTKIDHTRNNIDCTTFNIIRVSTHAW
jgi:hypothetical protein